MKAVHSAVCEILDVSDSPEARTKTLEDLGADDLDLQEISARLEESAGISVDISITDTCDDIVANLANSGVPLSWLEPSQDKDLTKMQNIVLSVVEELPVSEYSEDTPIEVYALSEDKLLEFKKLIKQEWRKEYREDLPFLRSPRTILKAIYRKEKKRCQLKS